MNTNRFIHNSIVFSFLVFGVSSCKQNLNTETNSLNETEKEIVLNGSDKDYKAIILSDSIHIAKGFDFPVGKPNAKGYYNAQKFRENNHLGDDWNGIGGGNTDLGDAIYSIANGYISEAKDYEGGWGKVVRVVHLYKGKLYESLYAHCDSILVVSNQFIKKGEQIATIGNCDGAYYAHLHLEIRDNVGLEIGGGYSTNTNGYLDPTDFINKNR